LPSGDQIAGLETEAALEAPPSPLSGSNRNVSDLFTSIEDSVHLYLLLILLASKLLNFRLILFFSKYLI
jgi:hypothetical protein